MKYSLRIKILFIPAFTVLLMLGLFTMISQLNKKMLDDIVYPKFKESILNASKIAMKTAVEAEAMALADEIRDVSDPEKQKEIIERKTDNIRFFDDDSGYFFTYDLQGTRISVPPNKSGNGKNFIDLKDKKGNYLIKGLIEACREGGRFYQYYFEKPGKGVQPKLSYVKLIPGTEFFVGTGVYIDNVEEENAALRTNISSRAAQYNMIAMAFFATIVVIAVLFALIFARSITKPISIITSSLAISANEVKSAATQVSNSSQSLAMDSNRQAAGHEEASSSLEEMNSMTSQTADNAKMAKDFFQQANQLVRSGEDAMSRMSNAIDDIQQSATETNKIVKTIDEIAFQTNLLALNAAVEAARAGEAGKGFAVVAEEVRNLAMRAAEAARSTTSMLEESVQNATNGVEIVNEVGTFLTSITETVSKTSDLIINIDNACSEQSIGIKQVSSAIQHIDTITQSNASNSEESASAAEELTSQAEHLNNFAFDLEKLING